MVALFSEIMIIYKREFSGIGIFAVKIAAGESASYLIENLIAVTINR